ncbi:rRNA-processing protein UTP23 homolog [Morus notabilis]|uniref:rRNA-processing protein UTP23 homolog n=1 Tax=Morus notabilis TaxID=981085 RepID=UPI000CED66E0|nr:rRNA-processing protein UTP23 homolog [Morus notabilis]
MRLKKQRRVRKSLRLYVTCFGFRKPFKVLCDGTFVHHLLVNRIVPADDALTNLLGAPVKLFTTRCVLAELKRLGQAYSESLDAANNLMIARCEHEKPKAADACIAEIIGETNSEHFFVASQDGDLRKKFKEIHGVPIIFALRNALFLEPISATQREHAKTLDKERSHMSEREQNVLKERVKNIKEEIGDQNLSVQAFKNTPKGKNGMWVKDTVQFKRKKVKGPNPLSCKKKKNPLNKNPVPAKQKESGNDDAKRCRTRNRKTRKRKRPRAQAEN